MARLGDVLTIHLGGAADLPTIAHHRPRAFGRFRQLEHGLSFNPKKKLNLWIFLSNSHGISSAFHIINHWATDWEKWYHQHNRIGNWIGGIFLLKLATVFS